MWNRRNLLCSLGALPLMTAPSAYAKSFFSVGSGEVTSVSDGHLTLPASLFFDDLPQNELKEILASANVSREELSPPCNLTLFRSADRLVLFDAGSGSGFMESSGKILESLDALGVAPDQITHVIFTHAHPDHLWGILDDFDDPVFYEAEHMISNAEWAYWTDPETVQTIGDFRASFAVGAARRLDAIKDQITIFNPGDEVIPGVMAHATPGHTPGHTSFEIRDGAQAVLIGGDAIGNHHVALARPEWASAMDQDPALAAATRVRLLDQIVADEIALLGFHLPQGGLGHIDHAGGNYHFIPERS